MASRKAAPRRARSTDSEDGAATALLEHDHRAVEALFEQYEGARTAAQKEKLVAEICLELTVHAALEEELFYPAVRKAAKADDDVDEAEVEHDTLKVLLAELKGASAKEDHYDAKVTVLKEYTEHHVEEEEKPEDGLFAKARDAGIDTPDMADTLCARKAELLAMAEAGELAPQPAALRQVALAPA